MPGRGTLARRNGLVGPDGVVDDDEAKGRSVERPTRVPRKARLAHAATVGTSGVGSCARVRQANWRRMAGESPAGGRSTNHLHPESCAGRREAAGEALTGARMGGAIEHRNQLETGAPRPSWRSKAMPTSPRRVRGWRAPRCRRTHARSYVPPSGPGRSSFRPGSRTGAAEGRRIP